MIPRRDKTENQNNGKSPVKPDLMDDIQIRHFFVHLITTYNLNLYQTA